MEKGKSQGNFNKKMKIANMSRKFGLKHLVEIKFCLLGVAIWCASYKGLYANYHHGHMARGTVVLRKLWI